MGEMGRRQCKNSSNNLKGNMTPPESRELETRRIEHPTPEEIEEIDSKRFFMKIIEELKQEVKICRKEMEDKYNKKIEEMSKEMEEKYTKKFEEMSKSVNEILGNQEKTIKQVMETVQDLKTEMESMKKSQTEGRLAMENLGKRTETSETSITNRIQEIEERISDSEDTIEKLNTLTKENSKSNKFSSQNIQELWDTIKKPNLRIIGVEEGEELHFKGPENILNKIIEENFPILKNDIPMKVQEAYRTPNRLDQKKTSPRHIIIKTQSIQTKERILRAAKEKGQVTYKGKPIRLTPDFSMETMKARRSWIEVLQKLRDHGCKPRLLYPAKLSFTINGENKIFQDKNKFKQYVATNPALQRILEGKSQPKESNIPNTAYINSDI